MLTRNTTAPTIQVAARPSRHPAPQNWTQRCSTMKMKNICTDQKCTLLKNRPSGDTCHQAEPMNASTMPLMTTHTSAAMVTTPNTYTHDPTYAGCRVGSSSLIG